MKYLLILIGYSFLILSCKSDSNVAKYGTFEMDSRDGSVHTIVRTKNMQTEDCGKSNMIVQYKIEWLTPCRYILTNPIITKGHYEKKLFDSIIFDVVEVKGNSHIISAKLKGVDGIYMQTLRKIK